MDVEEQFKNALSRADAMPVQPPNTKLPFTVFLSKRPKAMYPVSVLGCWS